MWRSKPGCPRLSRKSPTAFRAGFTLIELLIAACLLVIILGLAVSLSRHVRAQSARMLTSDLLARMERMLDVFLSEHPLELLDGVVPLMGPERVEGETPSLDEGVLLRRAIRNNREWLRLMTESVSPEVASSPELLGRLSLSVYDPRYPSLRDAWGTPIVFVRRTHPRLGMAPRDAPFFLSAGPDRRFLTVADNLYSYEAFPRPH